MILQLCNAKLDFVSIDGIDRIESSIREKEVITGLGVDDDVEAGGHLGGDDQAEGYCVREDVRAQLSS